MAKAKTNEQMIIAAAAPVEIKAAQGEGKSSPTFDVIAYRGGLLNVRAYELPVVIDLAGMGFARSVAANFGHDEKQPVGHVTEKKIENNELHLSGVFSFDDAPANKVVSSASKGFPFEASVEVSPTKLVEVSAGKAVQVNGQEFSGPIYVARKSTLSGFGFVLHGADKTTDVKIAASLAASPKENQMDEKFKAWIEAMLPDTDVESLPEATLAKLKAQYDGQKTRKAQKLDDVIATAEQEEERRQQIADITAQFIADNPQRDGEFVQKVKTLAEQAIEAKWSAEKYDTELLRASRPQSHTVFASRERDSRLTPEVIEAAICMAGNLNEAALNKSFDEKVIEAAHKRFKGRIGLTQVFRICAEANGWRGDNYRVNEEMQNAAFGYRGPNQIHATQFSTLNISGILANSTQKFLLEGWGGGEMTWRDITNISNVPDFKERTSYKLSGNMKYKKVGADGEIKHGKVSEDSYTNKAETYGIIFAVGRTDFINDDLNAIAEIPREQGYGANDAFNEVFWTEFLDNASFFAGGNNNTSTGAVTAANALTALAAAEEKFFSQTKPNGTPLGIMPSVWLLPPGSFRVGYNALFSPGVTGGSTTVPEKNSLAGLYRPVMSAYIANSNYTGYSTVKNYLLSVRPGFAVIDTAFLNGQQNPTIETAQAAFNVLGVEMRAYHDFGVNKWEYRAGVQGSGA